jgi:hypothetical protein
MEGGSICLVLEMCQLTLMDFITDMRGECQLAAGEGEGGISAIMFSDDVVRPMCVNPSVRQSVGVSVCAVVERRGECGGLTIHVYFAIYQNNTPCIDFPSLLLQAAL